MSSAAVRSRRPRGATPRPGSDVGGAGARSGSCARTGSRKDQTFSQGATARDEVLGTDEYELLRPPQKAHGAALLFHDVVEVREVVRREVEYLLALVGEPCHEAGSVAGVLLEVLGQPPEQLRKDDGITLEGRLVADRDA